MTPRVWRAAILTIVVLAFYLRLRALTLFQFHMDEFFTLTAANIIATSGLPLYPTGLFYDPGLPFSYIDGILFWLLGFSEALGRWPAIIFGTLSVVAVYWLGSRALRSQAIGVLAALWLALSLESVEWSGRARMITLAQWLVLMSVALLWLGLTRDSVRYRLFFAISYGLTLLSHFATIVLMPAWIAAALVLWKFREFHLRRALVRDALIILGIFLLVAFSGALFQPPPSVTFQATEQGLDTKVGLLSNKFLQVPSDVGHAWEVYGPYFLDPVHGLVLVLGLLGLAVTCIRLIAGRRRRQDVGALYLGTIILTVMVTLALVVNPHWQRSRYLLMQIQGVFLLLGAHGWQEVIELVPRPASRRSLWQLAGAVILAAIVTAPFLADLEKIWDGGSTGWNRYDQAFKHVRAQLADGDKVVSMHPPASLLYLEQSDYYLVQSSPKLIVRPDGALGDRYSGAIWLQSAEEFGDLIAGPNRVWLVAQEFWLFNSYDGYLQQQILGQMDKMWGEGGVWALASRPGSWPLAREVDTILQADFDGGTRLLGFTATSVRPKPGEEVRLTLFWQNAIPHGAKVFLHLRDESNQTVAQADHFIYDGKVPSSRWPSLLNGDTVIRDGTMLRLPDDLQPGVYRLVAGFYHPETFERLAVVGDQSGENAVLLNEWVLE
ncbi:MAG: glycosyltransferase family 39 protein [Anaerolineae bacterium]|nr:glycosyltransferase family 39 protein [Anaerolineae bacterium]